jgi:hypothetical protein
MLLLFQVLLCQRRENIDGPCSLFAL